MSDQRPPLPYPAGAGRRGGRAMSLVFRFEVALDDRKLDVANRPGDALRLRAGAAGQSLDLDASLKAGGFEAYETLFKFAWQATRHHDDYTDLGWDEFMDRCEAWSVLDDETGGPVRPTDAGPSNA